MRHRQAACSATEWDDHDRGSTSTRSTSRRRSAATRWSVDANWVDVGRGRWAPRAAVRCAVGSTWTCAATRRWARDAAATPSAPRSACCAARAYLKALPSPAGTTGPHGRRGRQGAQRRLDLPETGRLTRSTWTGLLARGGRPLLKVGDTGASVLRLQRALTAALGRPVRISTASSTRALPGPFSRPTSARPPPATGVVTDEVWDRLNTGRAEAQSQVSQTPVGSSAMMQFGQVSDRRAARRRCGAGTGRRPARAQRRRATVGGQADGVVAAVARQALLGGLLVGVGGALPVAPGAGRHRRATLPSGSTHSVDSKGSSRAAQSREDADEHVSDPVMGGLRGTDAAAVLDLGGQLLEGQHGPVGAGGQRCGRSTPPRPPPPRLPRRRRLRPRHRSAGVLGLGVSRSTPRAHVWATWSTLSSSPSRLRARCRAARKSDPCARRSRSRRRTGPRRRT